MTVDLWRIFDRTSSWHNIPIKNSSSYKIPLVLIFSKKAIWQLHFEFLSSSRERRLLYPNKKILYKPIKLDEKQTGTTLNTPIFFRKLEQNTKAKTKAWTNQKTKARTTLTVVTGNYSTLDIFSIGWKSTSCNNVQWRLMTNDYLRCRLKMAAKSIQIGKIFPAILRWRLESARF